MPLRLIGALVVLLGFSQMALLSSVATAQAETGALLVHAVDQDGAEVEDTCAAATSPNAWFAACDNDDRDADQRIGWIRVEDIVVGIYELGWQSSLPTISPEEGAPVYLTILAGTVASEEIVYQTGGSPKQTRSRQGSSQECEMVELYPGYPGYRGYVTGLDGVGDHACLNDLLAEDAFFSRDEEDRENRRAGRRLGIQSSFDEWTWENWLAVEAERGMTPTCYACALFNADERAEPRNTPVLRDDPRLLLGELGEDSVYRRYAAKNNISTTGFVLDDYQLRAIIGMANPGEHLNATELLDGYENLLDQLHSPGQFLDAARMCRMLAKGGGYFPVPENAAADDQVFAVLVGLLGIQPFAVPDFFEGTMSHFERLITGWRQEIGQGGQQTFAEYLQAEEGSNWC